MSDNKQTTASELVFFDKIRRLFKRKRKVKKGDLGIYEETLSFTSIGNSSRTIHYDIFIKVKALEVFDDLVEVEVVSVNTTDTAHIDTCQLMNTENLKYLDPSKVKWQKVDN